MSMYRGERCFNKEQLIFVVEAILVGALDRIESGLPTSIQWHDRNTIPDPTGLTPYDFGALECAGMSLAVIYAQLTGDGLGIGDALVCADNFDDKVKALVYNSWKDQGKKVFAKMEKKKKQNAGKGYNFEIKEVLPGWPNTRKCAEVFVKKCFPGTQKLKRCGGCENYHPVDFVGECRDDMNRFPTSVIGYPL